MTVSVKKTRSILLLRYARRAAWLLPAGGPCNSAKLIGLVWGSYRVHIGFISGSYAELPNMAQGQDNASKKDIVDLPLIMSRVRELGNFMP